MFLRRFSVPLALLAAFACLTVPALGQDERDAAKRRAVAEAEAAKEKDARKEPAAEQPKPAGKQVLRLYEWGVETLRWDGGPEPEFDGEIPKFYYEPNEVSVDASGRPIAEPKPDTPKPEAKPAERPQRRKPVVYFACDSDVTFDLDVKFTRGKVTWMYPKPSRLVDATLAQWDNIQLYSDAVTARDKTPLLNLPKVDASHWAAFSRDGATSSLMVNDETERFIFYEGDNAGLPEVDVLLDSEGRVVIRNYSAHALSSLRFSQGSAADSKSWFVASIPAASGDNPGQVVLAADATMTWEAFSAAGSLRAETSAAGLTAAQAAVFERAWQGVFFKQGAGTLSYRRDMKALDEMMELKVTLPEGFGFEQSRVGYVFVHGIDLSRQAEIAALVTSAAEGHAESATKLSKMGMAAVSGMRSQLADAKVPLARRVAVAKLLAEFGK